jgi:hypothetical protein
MIEKLTPEQEATFPEYVERFTKIGLTTMKDIVLGNEVNDIIAEVYKHGDLEPPKEVVIVSSPFEAVKKAKEMGATEFFFCYGSMDANWIAFYTFFREQCNLVKETEKIQGLYKALRLGWFLPYKDVCIVSQHAKYIKQDSGYRLHCEDGPAVEWTDRFCMYAWHGVVLNKYGQENEYSWIITNPERITTDIIGKESNVEIRRIMIERIGYGQYLKLSNAVPIDQDRFGILYSLSLGEDFEDAKVLQVEDSTPDAEGKRRKHFLTVPPTMKYARQAVAWTAFVEDGWEQYEPKIET